MTLPFRLSYLTIASIVIFLVSDIAQSKLIYDQAKKDEKNQSSATTEASSQTLRFMTDDFSAALIFRSSQFLKSKLITELRNLQISVINEEAFVFSKVEQVDFLYEKSLIENINKSGARRNFPITLIFHFEEEMNPDELFDPKIFGKMEDSYQDGLAVKVPSNPGLPDVFHFVNKKTLIATRASLLTKIVNKKSTNNLLIRNLTRSQNAYDLVWVADRSLPAWWVRSQIRNICPLLFRPELSLFWQLPYDTKIKSCMVGLNTDTLLEITLDLKNTENSEVNKQFMSDLLMKHNMDESLQKIPAYDAYRILSNKEQEMLTQCIHDLAQKTTCSKKGNLLTFSVPRSDMLDHGSDFKLIVKILSARSVLQIKSQNLKEIGLSLHNYLDEFGALPAARGDHLGNRDGLSWRVHVLPFLGHRKLYSEFHLDEPWDSPHNKALIPKMPDVFASSTTTKKGITTLHIVEGKRTAFPTDQGVRLRDFLDGTSYTIFVIETSPMQADIWTKPGGLTLDKNAPVKTLGDPYYYGFLTLFADGSVRTIQGTLLNAKPLKALFTRDGAETIEGL